MSDRESLAANGASFIHDDAFGTNCCICFEYWTIDALYVDAGGVTWDVCKQCAAEERA